MQPEYRAIILGLLIFIVCVLHTPKLLRAFEVFKGT
jgi:hypothetical protein